MPIDIQVSLLTLLIFASTAGCGSKASRLNVELSTLGGKYHCDELDEYCWLRIADENFLGEVVERFASSGLETDAIICNGLSVRTQDFDRATRLDHPLELHLRNCIVEIDHDALESVWLVDLRGADYEFSQVDSFGKIETLMIDSDRLTEHNLEVLKRFTGLRQLTLSGSLPNQDILLDLMKLSELTAVHLDGTQIGRDDEVVDALRSKFRVGLNRKWLDKLPGSWRNQTGNASRDKSKGTGVVSEKLPGEPE